MRMAADDIKTYLDTSARRPLEMEQDGRRARSHSLRDTIAAHKYIQGLEQTQTTNADGYLNLGVRTCRIEPGGSA
jgi:hypothetical protein